MRPRLILCTSIAAVLLTVAPAPSAGAVGSGRSGWFSASTIGLEQRVQLVARLRTAQHERMALVAAALTTTPPPEPAPAPVPLPLPVTDPASYTWPGSGPITSPFGSRWGRAHAGIDIDGPTGSPVVAARAGTVTLAGWKNGYGNTVIIDHGEGIETLYAHQSRLVVQTGQHVEQGQHLGDVGATGNVTAAHLHYEVHVGGVARDPMPWL